MYLVLTGLYSLQNIHISFQCVCFLPSLFGLHFHPDSLALWWRNLLNNHRLAPGQTLSSQELFWGIFQVILCDINYTLFSIRGQFSPKKRGIFRLSLLYLQVKRQILVYSMKRKKPYWAISHFFWDTLYLFSQLTSISTLRPSDF